MNKIKDYLKELDLNFYDLAKSTGLTPSYICALANNKKKNPSKLTMESIATALNKTVTEVFFPNEIKDVR